MTGPAEEGAKVATSLVANLKDQPITLALILFNLCFVAVVYFSSLDMRNHQEKMMDQLLDMNNKTQGILLNCVAPPPRPGG